MNKIVYVKIRVDEDGLKETVLELNCKETEKCIMIERGDYDYRTRRLSKDKLGIIEETNRLNNHTHMGFQTYVEPSQVADAKQGIKIKIIVHLREIEKKAGNLCSRLSVSIP